jgi:processive 1,2-diacylglycerol beta-glucosyltransferase
MKVLITYASAGAGHRRAAEAIYDYLKNNRRDLAVELVDILPLSKPFFRFCYNSGYQFLVHYAGWLWAFFFWMTQFRLTNWLSRKSAIIINYFSCSKFVQFLKKERFDFIISTHFLNSELAANLKLSNKIQAKLVTVITDFGVHPFWLSKGTDIYTVASDFTKDKLLKAGIGEEKIKVLGIPFSSNFAKSQNREKLAVKFGIEAGKFTVLIMTGSFGSGPLEEITKSICADVQVLVVCAKNKLLFRRLQKENLKNVVVFGFVNNPEELMAVADLIVTKPGGLSIVELLNIGLLPIFVAAIPGQEEENIKAMVSYNLGFAPKSIKQVKKLILDLKHNPEKLANLKNNISQVAKPSVCQELANVIR